MKLIKFLTNYKKENNNEKYIINEESKIEDIIDKVQDISDYFINIFKNNKTYNRIQIIRGQRDL